MRTKQNSAGAEEPAEVFRQFAWHLAGSLASARSNRPAAPENAKPRPGKGGARR